MTRINRNKYKYYGNEGLHFAPPKEHWWDKIPSCTRPPDNFWESVYSGWTFVFTVSEEMIATERGGHIRAQLDEGIQNICILTYIYHFFWKTPFFLIHFRYENLRILWTFSLQNMRFGRGNRFPKRKRKLGKTLRSYAWFLQSVSVFLTSTIIKNNNNKNLFSIIRTFT